jgi:hypothetical protein
MTAKTRTKNTGSRGGFGRTGRLAPAHRHDIPDLRLRPYRRWWVQLLLVGWRWRTELLTLAAGICVWTLLNGPLGGEGAVIAIVTVIAIVFTVPHSRRIVWPRVQCVASRHRLRTCLAQLAVSNRDGRLPWIMWIRPTPVGERAWLWMITGLSVDDINNRTEALAAACWARETRIERARTRAMVVRVDIVRRDPLSEPKPIDNPLLDGTSHVRAVDSAQVIELVQANTRATARTGTPKELRSLPLRPSQGHTVSSEGTKPTTSTKTATTNTGDEAEEHAGSRAPRIVTRHGEDVSDYV